MRGEGFLEAARRRKESIQVKTEHQDLLRFSLDEEWYGLGIENVVEVRECPKIFNIPHTPDHVVGVVNLRGEILSIIDIRKLLGLPTLNFASATKPEMGKIPHTPGFVADAKYRDNQKHIVVIERNDVRVGIMVDRAAGVVSIPDLAVRPPLLSGDSGGSRLIEGEAQLILFSIDLEFQSDLDSKNISKRLLQEFENKGASLSDKATISVEEMGGRWLITDFVADAKNNVGQVYSIRREEGRLNIYSGEVLAILDLDALMEE
jgi:purine-binding chemotaxis protein CheW